VDPDREKDMKKKITVLTLSALLVAPCFSVSAQQPAKMTRIGYLSPTGDANTPGPDIEAFRQGLRELGYVDT